MTAASESRPERRLEAAGDRWAATSNTVPDPDDYLTALDAIAESLRGRFVVTVEVGDQGHTRTHYYSNARAAERAVNRARARGASAHVAICQLLPAGVVTVLGGDR